MASEAGPLFGAYGIVKRFGAFTANDHIDLEIRAGEIHALLGRKRRGQIDPDEDPLRPLEPTEGVVTHRGETVRLGSPEAARRLGIGMVFQHFSLCENLTVAENIALVMERGLSRADLAGASRRWATPTGCISNRIARSGRSRRERQRIEIVRCLLQDPKLVILDEPTSVLTPGEAECCSRCWSACATRGGRSSTSRTGSTRCAASAPAPRSCGRARWWAPATPARGERRLARRDDGGGGGPRDRGAARRPGTPSACASTGSRCPRPRLHATALRDITLAIRGGEILGIAGIAGNGQAELFAALSGETTVPAEAVRIDGEPAGHLGINARRRLGAAFVPEERNGHAAAPGLSLSDNIVLSRHATAPLTRFGLVRRAAARAWRRA